MAVIDTRISCGTSPHRSAYIPTPHHTTVPSHASPFYPEHRKQETTDVHTSISYIRHRTSPHRIPYHIPCRPVKFCPVRHHATGKTLSVLHTAPYTTVYMYCVPCPVLHTPYTVVSIPFSPFPSRPSQVHRILLAVNSYMYTAEPFHRTVCSIHRIIPDFYSTVLLCTTPRNVVPTRPTARVIHTLQAERTRTARAQTAPGRTLSRCSRAERPEGPRQKWQRSSLTCPA